MNKRANIVLFYPRLGWMDAFILDLPLSLIYAAVDCRKHGIEVRIVDQRVEGQNWRTALTRAIDENTLLAGFSIMSGNPILHALEAAKFVRSQHPDLPLAWGGMHTTICPESTLQHTMVDYIICGTGSGILYQLAEHLRSGSGDLDAIRGLGYKKDGACKINPMACQVDYAGIDELTFDDLPMDRYRHFNYARKVYTIFTSFGCPHPCRFCFAPIFYKHIKGRKWFPYETETVIDHIVTMSERYGFDYISIMDENFFLDAKRAAAILTGCRDRGINAIWGIRGARIDDLDRADDSLFELMSEVGVQQIMIGAESGSPRMLEHMKKGITVEQTIRVNQKFARFPKLHPSYNFISGLPGETVEDMFLTIDLILQMMKENPNASFSGMNQFIPFPGSELYDLCVEGGFEEPKTLEDWAFVDTHYNKKRVPWLDKKTEDTLHAIQAGLMFADNKIERELAGEQSGKNRSLFFHAILLGSRLYRPLARWRLRNHCFRFPIDYKLIRFAVSVMDYINSRKAGS